MFLHYLIAFRKRSVQISMFLQMEFCSEVAGKLSMELVQKIAAEAAERRLIPATPCRHLYGRTTRYSPPLQALGAGNKMLAGKWLQVSLAVITIISIPVIALWMITYYVLHDGFKEEEEVRFLKKE